MSADTAHLDGITFGPGDHICVFYRGQAERRRILSRFLDETARAGAGCLCILNDDDRAWIQAWLREDLAGTDVDLTIASYSATYTHGDSFDTSHMLDYWRRWGADVRPGARTVSDMSWAEQAFSTSILDEFMAYEAESTACTRELSAIALCLYDLDRLGSHVIIPALRAHPAVLVRGVLVRNPYCAQPAA